MITVKEIFLDVIRGASSGAYKKPDGSLYSSRTIDTWEYIMRSLGESINIPADRNHSDVYNYVIHHMVSKGASHNYIALCVNTVSAIASVADRYWSDDFSKLSRARPRIKPERVRKVWLGTDDISAIENVHLSWDSKLERARDLWLIMYYTGLRVSDLVRIHNDNVSNDTITLANQKTGKTVVIPIHPRLRPVLSRVSFPVHATREDISRRMKRVCELAKIDGSVLVSATKGGRRVDKIVSKASAVSCHTARRSLTTNLIRSGISHDIAGDMLGMSASTWAVYNRMTAEEKAAELAKTSFFR